MKQFINGKYLRLVFQSRKICIFSVVFTIDGEAIKCNIKMHNDNV